MVPLREPEMDSSPSCHLVTSRKKPSAHSDEMRFLEYLGTDFSYLQRFILASEQMARLVQTEAAQSSPEVQSKVVEAIEIAKDTLSEAGVSSRPFITCPAHLLQHREAYFNVLSASRSLVPYIEDPELKLRLRRLLLPLTSTSCFRVVVTRETRRSKADRPEEQPPRCDDSVEPTKQRSLSPEPSKPVVQRRKIRRAVASAVHRYGSSSTSYSSRASDSALRLFTGRSVVNPRRLKAAPYPSPVVLDSISRDHNESLDHREEDAPATEVTQSPPSPSNSSTEPASEQTPSELPTPTEAPCPKPALPPIQYVSPQTRQALGLLQQQRRNFNALYRKNAEESSTMTDANGDWAGQSRAGLSGIDCNVPDYGIFISPPKIEVYSKEEYDSADENFRKGLGWFPTSWRNERAQQATAAPAPAPAPASPPELSWNSKWDDPKQASHSSQTMMPAVGILPDNPEPSCIIM